MLPGNNRRGQPEARCYAETLGVVGHFGGCLLEFSVHFLGPESLPAAPPRAFDDEPP